MRSDDRIGSQQRARSRGLSSIGTITAGVALIGGTVAAGVSAGLAIGHSRSTVSGAGSGVTTGAGDDGTTGSTGPSDRSGRLRPHNGVPDSGHGTGGLAPAVPGAPPAAQSQGS